MGHLSFRRGMEFMNLKILVLILTLLAAVVACSQENEPGVQSDAVAQSSQDSVPPGTSASTSSSTLAQLPGRVVPQQERAHINPGAQHPRYNTVPATSGWHLSIPFAPVPWGVYDEFIPEQTKMKVQLENYERLNVK